MFTMFLHLPPRALKQLFDRKVSFAAAPDVFPPDRFNPGVMVLTPSLSVLEDMLSKISDLPSYDGRDTGWTIVAA